MTVVLRHENSHSQQEKTLSDTMASHPRLYIYIPAVDTHRAMVLYRAGDGKHKKREWEMIAWDRSTDTFTRGQWLMGKELSPDLSSISPCGSYFYYHYDIYQQHHKEQGVDKEGWASVDAVSAIPNFTALLYSDTGGGKWSAMRWDAVTGLPFWRGRAEGFPVVEYCAEFESRLLPYGPATSLPPCITVDGCRLLRDGVVILDVTNDKFEAREPFPAPTTPDTPSAYLVTPPPPSPPPPRPDGQCTGNKKDGTPCTRAVGATGRCFQHKE